MPAGRPRVRRCLGCATRRYRERAAGIVVALMPFAVFVLVTQVAGSLLFKPYRVLSASMLPTIDPGDRILADRYDRSPKIGDVVIVHPPLGALDSRCGEQAAAWSPRARRCTADLCEMLRPITGARRHVVPRRRQPRRVRRQPLLGAGPRCWDRGHPQAPLLAAGRGRNALSQTVRAPAQRGRLNSPPPQHGGRNV